MSAVEVEPGVPEGAGSDESALPMRTGFARWWERPVDDLPGVGPETAGERVVRLLGRGTWPGVAASAAGVSSSELRATQRRAAVLGERWASIELARELGEPLPDGESGELTADEWSLLEFGRALAMARARDEIERGEVIHATAMGERTRTVVTTKHKIVGDGDDAELVAVEKVERVEEIPPDPGALLKIQGHLYPERWTPTEKHETTVSGSVEVVHTDAKELVASVRKRLSEASDRRGGSDDEIVDAEVVEEPGEPVPE